MSNTNEQAAMDSIENRNHFDTALRNILGHSGDPPFHHADLSAIDLCWKVWNAAKQHARAERDAGEVCGDCGHNRNDHLGECKIPASELWLCPCEGYRPVSEHLTAADEPQPDHFPDITKMVQHARTTERLEVSCCDANIEEHDNGAQGHPYAFSPVPPSDEEKDQLEKLKRTLRTIHNKYGVIDCSSYTRKRVVYDYLAYRNWVQELVQFVLGEKDGLLFPELTIAELKDFYEK